MLLLFTDFGLTGPYVGQMRIVLAREAPGTTVVDLCHDLQPFDPQAGAYLLASLIPVIPEGAAVIGVVDPGVGSERRAIVLEADGRYYVGPDNGLFAVVARRAASAEWRELRWRPESASASFHGRDLFAPAAARLLLGRGLDTAPLETAPVGADWPDDLPQVIYTDRYGNAVTGIRAERLGPDALLHVGGRRHARARTFSDRPPGEPMWYENSNGLVEIAVNQGRADHLLGLRVGSEVEIEVAE